MARLQLPWNRWPLCATCLALGVGLSSDALVRERYRHATGSAAPFCHQIIWADPQLGRVLTQCCLRQAVGGIAGWALI